MAMAGAGGTKKLWLSDAPIEAQLPGHSDIPSTVRSVVVRPYGVLMDVLRYVVEVAG